MIDKGFGIKFGIEWDVARIRVMSGLKRIGHDIPIAGYSIASELEEMASQRKANKANQNG